MHGDPLTNESHICDAGNHQRMFPAKVEYPGDLVNMSSFDTSRNSDIDHSVLKIPNQTYPPTILLLFEDAE